MVGTYVGSQKPLSANSARTSWYYSGLGLVYVCVPRGTYICICTYERAVPAFHPYPSIHPSITIFRAQPRKYNEGLYIKREKRERESRRDAKQLQQGFGSRGLFGLFGSCNVIYDRTDAEPSVRGWDVEQGGMRRKKNLSQQHDMCMRMRMIWYWERREQKRAV